MRTHVIATIPVARSRAAGGLSPSCQAPCTARTSASGVASQLCLNKQEALSMACEFNEQLISFLPKMRVWALALTRNRAAADDLAQDVAAKVLIAQNYFIPGTNFSAWVHRIMINQFISN